MFKLQCIFIWQIKFRPDIKKIIPSWGKPENWPESFTYNRVYRYVKKILFLLRSASLVWWKCGLTVHFDTINLLASSRVLVGGICFRGIFETTTGRCVDPCLTRKPRTLLFLPRMKEFCILHFQNNIGPQRLCWLSCLLHSWGRASHQLWSCHRLN